MRARGPEQPEDLRRGATGKAKNLPENRRPRPGAEDRVTKAEEKEAGGGRTTGRARPGEEAEGKGRAEGRREKGGTEAEDEGGGKDKKGGV